MSAFGSNWQYEIGATLFPKQRIKGTAKLLKKKRNKTQKWEIKVTDTKTNEILAAEVIMAKESAVDVAKAHELAKAWRKKYES